jgi:hypothetical protein
MATRRSRILSSSTRAASGQTPPSSNASCAVHGALTGRHAGHVGCSNVGAPLAQPTTVAYSTPRESARDACRVTRPRTPAHEKTRNSGHRGHFWQLAATVLDQARVHNRPRTSTDSSTLKSFVPKINTKGRPVLAHVPLANLLFTESVPAAPGSDGIANGRPSVVLRLPEVDVDGLAVGMDGRVQPDTYGRRVRRRPVRTR